jgi:hypothetical protein
MNPVAPVTKYFFADILILLNHQHRDAFGKRGDRARGIAPDRTAQYRLIGDKQGRKPTPESGDRRR